MLFGCCHPALRVEARLTLMLRAVVGLTTPQIARAFLVSEPTMAQRLVRAKRKIVAAGISFDVPAGDQRPGRLDDVLTAISLAYNAGYLSPTSRDLTDDAIWLAELVTRSLPDEPEAWGLLALLTALDARSGTRFDAEGRLVLLAIRTGRVGIGSPSPEPRAMWSGRRPAADPGATSCRRRSRRATRRRPLGRTPTGCRS
jgi:RNA polymerase sigma-70 factor (ECF subfamily)